LNYYDLLTVLIPNCNLRRSSFLNIGEEHLSEKITAENFSQPLPKVPGESLRAYIERIETRWIGEALEETQGNRTRAAKMLGLTRQGLLKKISRYDIPL